LHLAERFFQFPFIELFTVIVMKLTDICGNLISQTDKKIFPALNTAPERPEGSSGLPCSNDADKYSVIKAG
jgi:hypothetical protein